MGRRSTEGPADGRPRRDVFHQAAAPGAANKEDLQSEAPPRKGEQWAKCRVSHSSFTRQLAGNQQVGVLGLHMDPGGGEPRHDEARDGQLVGRRSNWRDQSAAVESRTSLMALGFVGAPV